MAALKRGMQDLGWIEGRNVAYDLQIGGGDVERLQSQVREMVGKTPDVIASNSSGAMRALTRETRTIPIVTMNVTDLVAAGVIPSLARPGGT